MMFSRILWKLTYSEKIPSAIDNDLYAGLVIETEIETAEVGWGGIEDISCMGFDIFRPLESIMG